MIERIKKAREQGQESGFTLIELLVVIIILGILAAVVVFSVGGVTDKGQTSACKADTVTLRTAEEAYLAQNTTATNYVSMATLQSGGFLSNLSSLHGLTVVTANSSATPPVPPGYNITVSTAACGVAGDIVGPAATGTPAPVPPNNQPNDF